MKYGRKCSCCGDYATQVYVFNQGDYYACSSTCRDVIAKDIYHDTWEYLSTDINEDGDEVTNDEFYYTEYYEEQN